MSSTNATDPPTDEETAAARDFVRREAARKAREARRKAVDLMAVTHWQSREPGNILHGRALLARAAEWERLLEEDQ